jgi:hypothetical protein
MQASLFSTTVYGSQQWQGPALASQSDNSQAAGVVVPPAAQQDLCSSWNSWGLQPNLVCSQRCCQRQHAAAVVPRGLSSRGVPSQVLCGAPAAQGNTHDPVCSAPRFARRPCGNRAAAHGWPAVCRRVHVRVWVCYNLPRLPSLHQAWEVVCSCSIQHRLSGSCVAVCPPTAAAAAVAAAAAAAGTRGGGGVPCTLLWHGSPAAPAL